LIPPLLRKALGSDLGGAFYLHGEDEFRKGEAARSLVDAHLDPATADFNYDRLRGSELDAETLATRLGTPPMMAEWRIILLTETEALAGSKRTRDLLLSAVRDPAPGLALVMACSVPPRSSARFYRDLARLSRSVEFKQVGADDLPGWLMEWARERHGRELVPEAARSLAQAIGSDLAVLAQEMEKLDSVAPEGEAITLEHVEAAGTRVPRQDRWAWFDLVGERRFDEAITGLHILLEHGESGVGLTIGLATQLLRIGVVVDGGKRALEDALPGRQRWLARAAAEQASGWSLEEVEAAVEGLLLVDRLLKSSALPDRHHLETWLLEQRVRAAAPAATG
jgi:DNA polymerase III subunit delta